VNQLIYVETSIPSFYFETRPGAAMQARREWTQQWWSLSKWQDELVTSLWVLRELEAALDPKPTECLQLLEELPLLSSDTGIDALVMAYIDNKIMPADADGDARHLAVATFWKCDTSYRGIAATLPTPTKRITSSASTNASDTKRLN
jgi:hypothetical protein